MARALAEAVVLVLLLLLFFLGNVRAALTVAVVLPLSALGLLWGLVLAGTRRLGAAAAGLAAAATGLLLGAWGAAALLVGSLGTFAPFWGHHNLFLASPLASYISGTNFAVHGGGDAPEYVDYPEFFVRVCSFFHEAFG